MTFDDYKILQEILLELKNISLLLSQIKENQDRYR